MPTFATARTEARPSFGPAIRQVLARIGISLMPWQEQVAEVGGEIDPGTGLPAYREVIVTVPRQSGKTTLVLGWEVQRALGWDGPQRIVYSAQTGNDARQKMLDDQYPLLEPHRRTLGIKSLYRRPGHEGVWFKNGSIIKLMPGTEKSGHGGTLDLGVQDELFADKDFYRQQAMEPGTATRAAAQILISSTAGTEDAVALNAAVARGRQAVMEDHRSGTAYFEWSKPDDADIDCEDDWWRWMPALGHTIGIDAVRHARDVFLSAGNPQGFLRAYGNIGTFGAERVIPTHLWDAVNVDRTERSDWSDVAFAVEVNPERSAAAVAISDGVRCQVVAYRAGVSWVEDEVARLRGQYPGCGIAVDKTGPAASLVPDPDHALTGQEMAQACAGLFDAVADRKVIVQRSEDLDAALAGAAKRFLGDVWVWGRRSSTSDVAPLAAVSIARWAALAEVRGPSAFAIVL